MDRRERLDDSVEATRTALEGKQAEMWTALPGTFGGYSNASITATIQPAIAGTVSDERGRSQNVSMPVLPDVPVVFPGGGGFILTFPIKGGDEALTVFSSRCIDGWHQSGGVQPEAEQRMHDLSDGIAIPGLRSQARPLSPPADPENTQWRSEDGKTSITMTPDGEITVKAEQKITLEAPLIIIKGALSMLSVDGGKTTATLNGTLHATDDVTAAGISGNSHTHTGVQSGGGSTGGPQ